LPAMNTYEKSVREGGRPLLPSNPPMINILELQRLFATNVTCRMSFADDKGAMLLHGNVVFSEYSAICPGVRPQLAFQFD